jgi:hypothetical protein
MFASFASALRSFVATLQFLPAHSCSSRLLRRGYPLLARRSSSCSLVTVLLTLPAVAAAARTPRPSPRSCTTSYAFNAQMTGTTSAAQTFELANLGTAPLQISSIALSGSNASSFTVTTGAIACGSTLAANGLVAPSTSPSIRPSVANCSATLTIADNSATPTQTVALTGAATPAPARRPNALTPVPPPCSPS